MITMSKFPYARFGNNLWELAFLHSTARKHNTEYAIPAGWKYSQYFESKFPETTNLPQPNQSITEPSYQYDPKFWDAVDFKNQTVDVLGYFQNEKFFDRDEIRQLFRFKEEYVDHVREKYKYLFTRPTIAIGVRRTDYVTSGQYHILTPAYYLTALQKFENYRDCNIVFITDDRGYCYFHYQSLAHTCFPKSESDIEQFIFGTLVTEGWITANSTFHWWSAYLGDAKRVIQPDKLFAGKLLEKEGPNHFYIKNERFEIHEG